MINADDGVYSDDRGPFLILIAHAQNHQMINAHADVYSDDRSLLFCQILHPHSYFLHASNEGSGESEHMRRIALVVIAR